MLSLLSGLLPGLIDKGVELFDKKFTTEAEKQKAIDDYKQETAKQLQAAWDEEQKQLTERHKQDMNSDSWLSKNVRPMALVYLMALFTIAFFMEVPESVLDMLQNLLMTVFVFYFGSRTLEKMTTQLKK